MLYFLVQTYEQQLSVLDPHILICNMVISVHILPLNRISVLVRVITFGDSNTHTDICVNMVYKYMLAGCVVMHFQLPSIVWKRNKIVNVNTLRSISANLVLNKCFRTNRVKTCAFFYTVPLYCVH